MIKKIVTKFCILNYSFISEDCNFNETFSICVIIYRNLYVLSSGIGMKEIKIIIGNYLAISLCI